MRIEGHGFPVSDEVMEGLSKVHRAVLRGEPHDTFVRSPGHDKRVFVARVDGQIVGFKFGAQKIPGVFHSRMGAVLESHRGQGIGRALLEAQHRWATVEGYKRIHTETFNVFRQMLRLNLASGFEIVGMRAMSSGEPHLLLEKDLGADPDVVPAAPVEPVEVTYSLATLPLDPDVIHQLDALHSVLFGGEPGRTFTYLQARDQASCWLARVDGRIVGFKFGARYGFHNYHSHEGGVHPDRRRQGVARRLMELQHEWARAEGYTSITTNTFSRFRGMLLLNLEAGFDIVGTACLYGKPKPKLYLSKRLDGTPGFGPETYEKP